MSDVFDQLVGQDHAVALLRAAVTTARSTSYEGVTSSRSGTGLTVRLEVVHRPGTGTVTAPEGGGGRARLTVDASLASGVPGPIPFLDLLIERFAVVLRGEDDALGRVADVIEAQGADGAVRGRFWVDRDTGLIVRRELLGPGQVSRLAEFVSLRVPATDGNVDADVTETPAAKQPLDAVAVGRLRSEGWLCPEGLPGGLVLVTVGEAEAQALHLVYSDGLEVISLFVQRGRLDPATVSGLVAAPSLGPTVLRSTEGAPTWVWPSGGSVLTLITDAPEGMIAPIISALPPDPT